MNTFSSLAFGILAFGGATLFALRPQAQTRYVPIHPPVLASAPLTISVSQSALAKAAAKTPVKAPGANSSSTPTFEKDVLPVVQKYCVSCHSMPDASADLDLEKYKTAASVLKAKNVWENVAKNVHASHMPPRKMPQPTQTQRERMVRWIEETLAKSEQGSAPARVTLRRLNREEYNNTIRDLLRVDFKPAADFPTDDVGYGFDNIGDVLSMSPLLMEKYLTAAEKISMQAINAPDANIRTARFDGAKLEPEKPGPNQNSGPRDDGGRMFYSNGEAGTDYNFSAQGEYSIRVRAWAQQAGDEPARLVLNVGSKEVSAFDVEATDDKPQTYTHKAIIDAGKQRVSVAFTNDFYNKELPEAQRDRNLVVQSLTIEGPRLVSPQPTALQRELMPRNAGEMTPEERQKYAREIMAKLARRAYRRPVTKAEVEKLARFVDLAQKDGDSFERGVQIGIQAMLVSPYFLFRVERDANVSTQKMRALDDHELATRLSYFLWSSMPDDSVSWWADQGRLRETQHLTHQVRRMLKDPKAGALASSFAMQWLELRRLNEIVPDPDMFPRFTPELRDAMQTETLKFCEEIIRQDKSIIEFLDANWTYLNEPLAKHYGIDGVKGNNFQRVVLSGENAKQRGGILTQASVLTVTSNPTRTSPVKRGKWVLDAVLGAPPPPPPPDVPDLSEEKSIAQNMPMRQRLEEHRKNPACSSCHVRMDPIGFGLENYDAIGAWRTREGKFSIDASGELSGGRKFNGPSQLKVLLKNQKDDFARALAEKMLTYALGRGIERSDKPAIDAIVKSAAQNNYRFSSLVLGVVESAPFRNRRVEINSPSPAKLKSS